MKNQASPAIGTKLLLDCLAAAAGRESAKKLGSFSSEDWESFVGLANRHGLGPLLYSRLKALGPAAAVPPEVIRKFEPSYRYNLKRNIKFFHEFAKLALAFQREDVPLIALKGTQIAESVYGNPGVRPMADMDVLVKKNDLDKAEHLLKGLGFITSDYIGRIERDVECGISRELPPYYKPGGVSVDVHWTLEDPASPFAIDVEGLWARARAIEVSGIETRGLSSEDLILHMCLHTAYHDKFRAGLMPLCDVAEIIRKCGSDMDWAALERRTLEWKAGKWVYLTLLTARDLLRAPVPDGFLERMKPVDFYPEIANLARAKIMARDEQFSPLSPNLTLLWGGKPLGQKAAAYLRRLFPGREYMARMYPAANRGFMIYFYYLVRLKDLSRRYGLKSVYRMYVHGSWSLVRDKNMRDTLAKRDNVLMDWLAESS
jgi:hypothetical protein